MKELQNFLRQHFQLLTAAFAFLIGLWGVLTIYSARSAGDEPFLLAGKQLGFLAFSLAAMLALAAIPFRIYLKYWKQLAGCAYIVLLLVLFFGVKVNGMRGWFTAGPFYIQPSELAKGIYLLALIQLNTVLSGERRRFLAGAALTLLWTLPILLQPDFGTASVYWMCWMAVSFLCGAPPLYLAIPPLGGLFAGVFFVLRNPYAWRRIEGFLNPDADLQGSGWHIRQFQLAIARGGLHGEKLGNAFWSNSYLPFSYNDSAYAALAETLGLLGAGMLLFFFAALLGLLIFRALEADEKNAAARRILAGSAAVIAIQLLLHCAVNTTLLPPTGITLPLVSYGGSSLLGTFAMLGVAVSAARSIR